MAAKKLPPPCVGICKFRRQGHCIGCSMTKPQKKLSKKAKSPAERRAIVELVAHQQASLGGFDHWRIAYRRKCIKKGVKAPEFS